MSDSVSSASSYEPNKPNSNRRFRVPSNPWLPYIGDCTALEKYLNSKHGIGWLIPKYLNALLRGISQVVFANNPLSGLIVLIALFWSNVFVGLAATVAGTTAIITSVLMRQEQASISAGLTTYNAVLVGTVMSSLWTPLYGEAMGSKIWCFIVIGAALSVFVTSAISNMLSSFKISLPALTLPFNLVILLIFISLMPRNVSNVNGNSNNSSDLVALRLQGDQNQQFSNHLGLGDLGQLETDKEVVMLMKSISRKVRKTEDMTNEPTTDFESENEENLKPNNKHEVLNWGKILAGIIVSSGQVYGVHDEIGSVLIYVGIMVYSPILLMMSVFGAILGTACGIFFTPAPYEAVYAGIWGYNGLLSAAAIGGFFIVLTCHSFWNAVVNVIFTVLVQQTLAIALGSVNLPVFTIPFVVSTLLFLSVTTRGNHMPRVTAITFPEMHRYNYREAERVRRLKQQDIRSEIPEEKGLVLTDVKVVVSGTEEKITVVANVESIATEGDDDETECNTPKNATGES